MDYFVEDVIDTLKNVKNNPYGIKDTYHSIDRAQKRSIDPNVINKYLYKGLLVGIEKSYNETKIFELLYEHNIKDDLSIIINILNENEIEIITIIKKTTNRRKHYAN